MVLRRAGCFDEVSGVLLKPQGGEELVKWLAAVNEGLTIIGLTVATSQYGHIRNAKDGAEAWRALADIYEKDSRATRISLKRQIYGYKHSPTAPIQDYISGITGLAARLQTIKINLTETDITDILIFNLDESYSSIAASLTATKGTLSVADVTSALIDEEGRRVGNGSIKDPKDEAFSAQTQKGFRCFNCGKLGHKARNCRAPKKETNAAMNGYDSDGVW